MGNIKSGCTMIYDVTDTQKYGYGVRGSPNELVFTQQLGISVPDYVGLMCKYQQKKADEHVLQSPHVHWRGKKYPSELMRL